MKLLISHIRLCYDPPSWDGVDLVLFGEQVRDMDGVCKVGARLSKAPNRERRRLSVDVCAPQAWPPSEDWLDNWEKDLDAILSACKE